MIAPREPTISEREDFPIGVTPDGELLEVSEAEAELGISLEDNDNSDDD